MPTQTFPPSPIRLLPLVDFWGGLNYRADAFQIHDSESPDMLNVDLDPRGGFALRDGAAVVNATALDIAPRALWQFATTTGTQQIMVQNSVGTTNQFAYSTGGNFTKVTPDALATAGKFRAATFKDLCFIQRNAENAAVKWTGAAATVLGTAFNDDLTAPTGANMPKAKCITVHAGYVWVANTVEAGTAFKSRVRWSHPNQPADFRTNDYIDVDTGHDGDEITALVPFGSRLLVFKNSSVYSIQGFDPASFSVAAVTRAAGCISQDAVTINDHGCYFFSWPEGLMHYDGQNVTWAFERIWPAIADGRIPSAGLANITVGSLNRRVWVGVPWVSGTTNGRTFVLDPSLARRRRYGTPSQRLSLEGGWTAYDIPIGPILEWQPPGAAATYLAAHATLPRVLKVHQSVGTDDYGAGAVNITSYYTTRWLDADNPAIIKRWKRPEIAVHGGSTMTMRVDVYHDFDAASIKRSPTFSTTAPGTGLVWDDGTHASNMKWATETAAPGVGPTWGYDATTSEVIKKLGVLGRSRAVRLTVNGPTPSQRYTVDAITLKYIPRRLRA